MNSKRSLKWVSEIIWLLLIVAGVVILSGLFRGLSAPADTLAPAKPTLRVTPIFSPTPPLIDDDSPAPTIDPFSTPTPTPNGPPPTFDATLRAFLKQTARPTGLPLPTLLPTATPLPTLSAISHRRYSAQNLRLGTVAPFGDNLSISYGDWISWSPDGQTLAINLRTGNLKAKGWEATNIALIDVNGRNLQNLTSGFMPKWSPSSGFIAYLDNDDNLDYMYVRILDIKTKQITLVTTITTTNNSGVFPTLAWLSENELLYYQDGVILFDYQTGQKTELFNMVSPSLSINPDAPMNGLAAEPNHGLIASASRDMLVIFEKSITGFRILKQMEGVDNRAALAFSPDGKSLAYVPLGGEVKITSVFDDMPDVDFPAPSHRPVWSISWSPDSASLIYVDSEGVHLVNRDGSGLQLIQGLPKDITSIVWSSQGTILLPSYDSNSHRSFFKLPILPFP